MKNKIYFLTSLFSLLIGGSIFDACKPPNDATPPCHDPIVEHPFPNSAARWMLSPIIVGDTMKFNVFHRNNRSSPYVFRNEENYIVKDTIIKKFLKGNNYSDNCNDFMYSDYLTADIYGPGKDNITCALTNSIITSLIIGFKYKTFTMDADIYLSHQYGWYDSLIIGSQKYRNINIWKGLDNAGYYTDSTYVLYNQQYGPLKFIVNDTLIYQRTLH